MDSRGVSPQLRELVERIYKMERQKKEDEERGYSFELASPFSDAIISAPVPAGTELPTDRYDGTTDPEDHLKSFKAKMILWGLPDPVMCKVFPCTLEKGAVYWLHRSLPPRSIHNFKELSKAFVTRFCYNKARTLRRPKMEERGPFYELASPFSDAIIGAPLPEGFELPSLDPYDGTTDPVDHLESFKAMMMIIYGLPDPILCRAFPCTLQKAAITWFYHLLPGSIHNFKGLSNAFVDQFAFSEGQQKRPKMEERGPFYEFSSAFSDAIMAAPLPKGYVLPSVDSYDGTTDPEDHLQSFKAMMIFYAFPDPIMCRAFPSTLRKAAATWFHRLLPPGSIHNFKELSKAFETYFFFSKARRKIPADLYALKQRPDESIRAFLRRFNNEALEVPNVGANSRFVALKNAIVQENLRWSLCMSPPATMDELLAECERHMNAEESVASVAAWEEAREEALVERPRRKRFRPRRNRFRV